MALQRVRHPSPGMYTERAMHTGGPAPSSDTKAVGQEGLGHRTIDRKVAREAVRSICVHGCIVGLERNLDWAIDRDHHIFGGVAPKRGVGRYPRQRCIDHCSCGR
jgi:hypothetical protein